MIYIAPEDLARLQREVDEVVATLAGSNQRVDRDFDLSTDDCPVPVKITGYWIGDIMRIDIKPQVRKQ